MIVLRRSWLSRRRFSLTWGQWRRQALFVLGGIAVGAIAVALAFAADRAGAVFRRIEAVDARIVLVLTPAGFAACRWLTQRYVPNAGGSGIPQAIAARHLHGLAARHRLVSLQTAFGKIGLLLIGLLCGASIGREGPTVQVGAAIMFALGRVSPRRQPGLILAGAAAGVSAAFNTPLAGIVFGIEEMSRSFEARTSGVVLGAVIAAGLTSMALQGDYTYFGTTQAVLHGLQGWLAVPVLGVAGGLLGGGFSRALILVAGGLPGAFGRQVKRWPILFAAACGLLVAGCGLLSDGATFGTGYDQARELLDGGNSGMSFGLLKLVATLASAVSGIPGGIFAPSLAVGAGLGADLASLLPGAPVQALVVLGMAGYFAGVVQAPITAFVIVSEMTGDHAMVVPLMLTALIGYAASKLVCAEGVYHALARNFVAAALPPGARPPH